MEFPFILNDFILIISSISQFADFIFPRVSANVIIPEKTFLEAKMKRDVETDSRELYNALQNILQFVWNKWLSIAKLQEHKRYLLLPTQNSKMTKN